MIVDMVRNDLGRIGDTGSLMTTALHTVESFSTVHQLTSTVEVQTDAGLFDVFAATFPGASITGAPKVNTAGFIADLERHLVAFTPARSAPSHPTAISSSTSPFAPPG